MILVAGAHLQDAFLVGQVVRNHELHQRTGQEKPDHHEQETADGFNQQAVPGSPAGFRPVFFSQAAAEQAVDTGSHTGGKGDHQHLEGERQGNRGQPVRVEAGNKNAVDNIVQCLDDHGDHDRHADLGNQAAHVHRSQDGGTVCLLLHATLPRKKIVPPASCRGRGTASTLPEEPLSVKALGPLL